MKVGTDGVLLGAWTPLRAEDHRILDIGTGTGVIALMLAQRKADATLTGIDLMPVAEAEGNARRSPWSDRIAFEQTAVQDYAPEQGFDLIVSNPPFFTSSLLCPDAGRTTARHAVTLTFRDLCRSVERLLNPEGHFAVVLPTAEGDAFRREALLHLHLVRSVAVRTTPRRAPKRVLMEFIRYDATHAMPPTQYEDLSIGTGAHEEYTDEYRALTCDFYLKF